MTTQTAVSDAYANVLKLLAAKACTRVVCNAPDCLVVMEIIREVIALKDLNDGRTPYKYPTSTRVGHP